MLVRGLQSKFVTERPEAEQAAVCDVTEITTVPKFFSSKRVAEMNLDKRDLNRQKGISQSHAGVRKAARIQDDETDVVGRCLLNPIDEFMFGVALETSEFMPKCGCSLYAAFLDVLETRCAVDVRFTRAQKVQIWAVYEEKRGH